MIVILRSVPVSERMMSRFVLLANLPSPRPLGQVPVEAGGGSVVGGGVVGCGGTGTGVSTCNLDASATSFCVEPAKYPTSECRPFEAPSSAAICVAVLNGKAPVDSPRLAIAEARLM